MRGRMFLFTSHPYLYSVSYFLLQQNQPISLSSTVVIAAHPFGFFIITTPEINCSSYAILRYRVQGIHQMHCRPFQSGTKNQEIKRCWSETVKMEKNWR